MADHCDIGFKQKAVIELLAFENNAAKEISDRLKNVYGDSAENKRQSMQRHHLGSSSSKKFKRSPSAGKVMMTVVWDHLGVIFIDFLPKGEIVNSHRYCDTLKN